MPNKDQFRFRRLDDIGAADADDDHAFLANCFVDTGIISALRDVSDPRRIVLGRTGSGKTSILLRLAETTETVIQVRPESLSLAYISNSTILNFLMQLNINLDVFFRLLWRHVFTVEIIKAHFHIKDEQSKYRFIEWIRHHFRDEKDKQALQYLEEWGKSFWEDTDYRIKEVTTKLETDVKSAIGATISFLNLSTETVGKLSEEQKVEITNRAQTVVNAVQIRQLSDVIDMLAQILDDRQKRYYVVIDRLDENWIEDRLRYKLIRALIETARDFRKIKHAKIIIALRFDLIDRVFRLTRDSGFQEEKYESLFLEIEWSRDQLIDVLDSRINHLVQKRYTKQRVTHKDILPRPFKNGQTATDYIIDRTMMRPRDIILFFNRCIAEAVDKPEISSQKLREAEGQYSRMRLRALADEWSEDYPNLIRFADILKNKKPVFRLDELTQEECENFCLGFLSEAPEYKDDLHDAAYKLYETNIASSDFQRAIIKIFYRVGLTGLKLQTYESVSWSFSGNRDISSAEIQSDSRVFVHPFAWRTLGIQAPNIS
jgi:hypothetical protein